MVVLVTRVLEWLSLEITDASLRAMRRWLTNNIVQWLEIASNIAMRGIQWGFAQLQQLRDHIIQRYNIAFIGECVGTAMAGFVIAGPVGAVVGAGAGAVAGLAFWALVYP